MWSAWSVNYQQNHKCRDLSPKCGGFKALVKLNLTDVVVDSGSLNNRVSNHLVHAVFSCKQRHLSQILHVLAMISILA